MAEELKNLIDRIQRDGVEKAKEEAEEIVSSARQKASELMEKTKQDSEAMRKKAEEDAKAYEERSTKAIRQAGRDVLIAVGHGVEQLFKDLIQDAASESLTPEKMADMIVMLAKGYAEHGMTTNRIEILVSDEDQKQLQSLFMEKYRKVLGAGAEIRSDDDIIKGFKISFKEGKVFHDFTLEAISEVMSSFLQPRLEKIVREAAEKPLA